MKKIKRCPWPDVSSGHECLEMHAYITAALPHITCGSGLQPGRWSLYILCLQRCHFEKQADLGASMTDRKSRDTSSI